MRLLILRFFREYRSYAYLPKLLGRASLDLSDPRVLVGASEGARERGGHLFCALWH